MRRTLFQGATRRGLLASAEPATWVDFMGTTWRTLQILGRIKYRYPSALALRDFVLSRDGQLCVSCGAADTNDNALLLDHIVSRRNGGSHHPDNLQALCARCNASKSATVDAAGVRA